MGLTHRAALDDGLPPADGLRTRAVASTRYLVADGAPAWAFVAVTARVGAGRSAGGRRRFREALGEAADAWVEGIDGLATALSVELQEIDPELRVNRNHVRQAMARRSPPG